MIAFNDYNNLLEEAASTGLVFPDVAERTKVWRIRKKVNNKISYVCFSFVKPNNVVFEKLGFNIHVRSEIGNCPISFLSKDDAELFQKTYGEYASELENMEIISGRSNVPLIRIDRDNDCPVYTNKTWVEKLVAQNNNVPQIVLDRLNSEADVSDDVIKKKEAAKNSIDTTKAFKEKLIYSLKQIPGFVALRQGYGTLFDLENIKPKNEQPGFADFKVKLFENSADIAVTIKFIMEPSYNNLIYIPRMTFYDIPDSAVDFSFIPDINKELNAPNQHSPKTMIWVYLRTKLNYVGYLSMPQVFIKPEDTENSIVEKLENIFATLKKVLSDYSEEVEI